MKSLTGSRVDKALDGPYLCPARLAWLPRICRGRAGEPRTSFPALIFLSANS
ncbi:hypothetical protein CSIRO_0657 [Bradyrhizobiaceae bacterium SG-6C]|nr:hypothetical protein CSIRO_0657 [Bradyrhizobiaceae bacterium SG-6C]